MAKKHNNGGGIGRLTSSAEASSKHNQYIIDDETLADPRIRDQTFCPIINGEIKGHGLIPRDLHKYPREMFDPPSDMPLLTDAEIDALIDQEEREQSSFEHLIDWPSLDQDGQGFCWFYSVTGAVMAMRKVNNQPYVRLSGHAGACKVKNFRDEGGWCGLSAKFFREHGCPPVSLWPEKSMDRRYDTPEVWTEAAFYKTQEEWVDLTRDVYDQQLTLQQIDSCGVSRIAMAWDFNWWSHSVFGGRIVKVEAGSRGRRIRNSWTDSYGERGWATLRGDKAKPDSAIAIRVVVARRAA